MIFTGVQYNAYNTVAVLLKLSTSAERTLSERTKKPSVGQYFPVRIINRRRVLCMGGISLTQTGGY